MRKQRRHSEPRIRRDYPDLRLNTYCFKPLIFFHSFNQFFGNLIAKGIRNNHYQHFLASGHKIFIKVSLKFIAFFNLFIRKFIIKFFSNNIKVFIGINVFYQFLQAIKNMTVFYLIQIVIKFSVMSIYFVIILIIFFYYRKNVGPRSIVCLRYYIKSMS